MLKPDRQVARYQSFTEFLDDTDSTKVFHPAFDFQYPTSLYATESRVILFSRGPLPHIFEITENQEGEVSVVLIDDLEGLGVETVVTGSANRFAILTNAGDAYLFSKGSLDPELLEIDDDSPVKLVGLGSKFEVLVTDANVWIRGESKCEYSDPHYSAR